MKVLILVLLLSLVLPVVGFCGDTVTLDVKNWFMDARADSVLKNGKTFNTTHKVTGDSIPEVRLTWHAWRDSDFRVSYMRVTASGVDTVKADVDVFNQVFTVATDVNADIDVKYGRILWLWRPIGLFKDSLKVGPVVGGIYVDGGIDITGNSPFVTINKRKDFKGGLPVVGLSFKYEPGKWIRLSGDVSGVSYDKYRTFDSEVDVDVNVYKNVSVFGGYRYIRFHYTGSPDINMRFKGPVIGLKISF